MRPSFASLLFCSTALLTGCEEGPLRARPDGSRAGEPPSVQAELGTAIADDGGLAPVAEAQAGGAVDAYAGPPHEVQAIIRAGDLQNVGYLVALDGSASTGRNPMGKDGDPFGIRSYAWSFGDGTPVQTGEYLTTVTHAWQTAGSFTVKLTVTDYAGLSASATRTISVGTLPKVNVSGSIASALTALGGKPGIVSVPAGTYSASGLKIPAGVILEGAGADRTLIVHSGSGYLITTAGDNVRVTGLELKSGGAAHGIYTSHRNLLVDHCHLHHFNYATSVSGSASGTVESSSIHDSDVAGAGYGVQIAKGGYAMIRKNELARNRHSVAAGGQTGPYVSYNTGYDFLENHVQHSPVNVDVAIDMHPTGHGRIRIVGNTLEDVKYGIGLKDGWGEIRGNTFRNIASYVIYLGEPVHNGNYVASAGCYHFQIAGNTFSNTGTRYIIEFGKDISVEGKPVQVPYKGDSP